VLPEFFPWADLSVDELTYEDAEEIVTEMPESDSSMTEAEHFIADCIAK
jgi:hypothetical protein